MNRILPVLDAADAESQLAAMADGAAYVELYKDYGKEIRVALTRVGGRPVGLVVGNGKENDGVLTAQSASKAARFIRLCDCYSLPVVPLINSKGVAVPAVDEQAATIKATTQLLLRLRGSDDGEDVHRHRQRHRSGVCRHGRQEQCRCHLRVAGRGDFRPDP